MLFFLVLEESVKEVFFMIKISLYENAFDSIQHGIEHLEIAKNECSHIDYKHALLALFQGVELLLKQLLYFKSPIYVFCKNSLYKKCNDPLNPTLDELFECKSLEIGELCREVKKYYNEFKSLKIVEDLAKERNKIQHFAIKFDEKKLVEDILKLNHKVITPSLRIIAEEIDALDIDKDELNMKIEKIFNLWDIAEKEEKDLNLDSKIFFRSGCPDCGNYSLFIFFEDGSNPTSYYCTSCNHSEEKIDTSELHICPECGWQSLIYSKNLGGGVCLCDTCSFCKESVLVDMIYCDMCNTYEIEGECKCNRDNEL